MIRNGGVRRGARVLRVLVVLGLLAVLALVTLNLRIAHQLDRVDSVFDHLEDRPAGGDGTTVLLIGTFARAAAAATVPWLPTSPGLESVMLVHVAADGRSATVDSFELEPAVVSEVTAAEPHRAVALAEDLGGRRVDHLVTVDWAALQQLADDNGSGVHYVPGSAVPDQQRFLRRVLEDTLHAEMRKEPWTLYAALQTVTRGMAVEADWSVLGMDLMVLSLRNLRSGDIEFRSLQDHSPISAKGSAGQVALARGR